MDAVSPRDGHSHRERWRWDTQNIFATPPSPENLKTFLPVHPKGFDAMEYKEHLDYDIVESSNPAFGKAIVRINVHRAHRQTIQYILPQHAERASSAELLVIDEAAAIALPTVQALLGPDLVFLCSTVNGYEGTGRALSLKLISNRGGKRRWREPTPGGGRGDSSARSRRARALLVRRSHRGVAQRAAVLGRGGITPCR